MFDASAIPLPFLPLLREIVEHRRRLSRDDARRLMQSILEGQAPDLQLGALLGALAARGETPAELAGFVDAMRAAATAVPVNAGERAALVDTCGTGGDASHTFNISTAAALVAAAAGTGLMVAKHGNRAVTSQSGSADVLEALGIPVGLSPADAAEALRRHRFAFLHAPSLHPALKAVMPVRRALGIRTVFNILGPLANPAGAQAQVIGVYAAHLVPIVAEAMALLGTRHAFVVHGMIEGAGEGGIDEFSLSGPTHLAEVRNGTVALYTVTPEQVGLTRAPIESLRGSDAAGNAAILRSIFAGETGPRRDVVLFNAAAVLVTAGVVPAGGSIERVAAAIPIAAHAIDSGAVTALVKSLRSDR
jgi:anthranilate phosphoribosyltransferase